jgi:hypothetical protein
LSFDLEAGQCHHQPALGERERRMVFSVRITQRTKGHYETQDVEYGKVYKWHPESVEIECEECGNRSTHTRSSLISSLITCECGKDRTAGVREELVFLVLDEDEELHPWRDWHPSKDTGIPF